MDTVQLVLITDEQMKQGPAEIMQYQQDQGRTQPYPVAIVAKRHQFVKHVEA